MFKAIERKIRKIGLRINEDKIKFMIIDKSQKIRSRIGQKLEISQYSFEVMNKFTHLRSVIITCDNNESIEVKKRLVMPIKPILVWPPY